MSQRCRQLSFASDTDSRGAYYQKVVHQYDSLVLLVPCLQDTRARYHVQGGGGAIDQKGAFTGTAPTKVANYSHYCELLGQDIKLPTIIRFKLAAI